MRIDRATELNNILEVNVKTKFIVLIIGRPNYRTSLYEIGRVIATCLADDVSLSEKIITNFKRKKLK